MPNDKTPIDPKKPAARPAAGAKPAAAAKPAAKPAQAKPAAKPATKPVEGGIVECDEKNPLSNRNLARKFEADVRRMNTEEQRRKRNK